MMVYWYIEVLGFTVPAQPNLRTVKCQHPLATWVFLMDTFLELFGGFVFVRDIIVGIKCFNPRRENLVKGFELFT